MSALIFGLGAPLFVGGEVAPNQMRNRTVAATAEASDETENARRLVHHNVTDPITIR